MNEKRYSQTLDKMYLEYSLLTSARTNRERELLKLVNEAHDVLRLASRDLPDRDDLKERAQEFAARYTIAQKGF